MTTFFVAKPSLLSLALLLTIETLNSQYPAKDTIAPLETVFVTAQKRTELMQKIPFAISSFNGTQAASYKLWNVKDLSGITPNLYSADPGDGRDVTSVRGIATTSYDPATAVYIDGVNQFGLDTYIPVLFDIERIEVLRGPQGPLYGRNAMGGVINIITKEPGNKISGGSSLSIGNYGQQRLTASLKTPLILQKLFLGMSVLNESRKGFYTNEYNGKPYDSQNGISGNYYLKYIASERWNLTLNLKHRNQQNQGAFPLVMGAEEALNHPFTLNQNATTVMKDHTMNAFLSVNYAGNSYQFSSQTAFQKNYRFYTEPIDGDFSPIDGISVINNYGKNWNNIKVWTQELKFSSHQNSSSPWKWTAGSYLFYQNAPVKQGTRFGQDANLMGIGDSLFTLISSTKSSKKGIAFYGQISYKLNKKTNLTLGLRNDWENQVQTVSGQYQHDPGNDLYQTQSDTSAQLHFNALSPKIAIDYEFSDNTMGYAQYTKGYRTGGMSPLGSDPSQPPLAPYLPEHSHNFEIGFKNSFWNQKAIFNLAVFYTRINDAQIPSLILPDAITITKNAGKLNSKGGEIELIVKPVNTLQIQYSIGYTKSVFETLELSQNGSSVNLKGNRQIFSPAYNSNLALQYTKNISAKWTGFVRTEFKQMGTTYFDLANTIKQNPYALLHASIGMSSSKFKIQLWGRNLTNQKYISYAYDFGAVHLGDPFHFGATISYQF